ncbi:permease [Parathermosynechococcus lividus PCC 6715]|jgi:predicted permease|uniref:Permease n=1 Tax=Parathermosynechococcus lividus PCC 6715 TaxID=1917166 RepID=A0A2D2Q039_PARLV|nr:AEC family transporter [Thermostichus lividus]ATS17874.1 permease [Thermostichus lividus PCC 6715]
MADAITATSPLILWTSLGLVLGRWLPAVIPQWLGRGLYWVGVPLQIFALVHHTDFTGLIWLSPVFAFLTLVVGYVVAQVCYPWQERYFLPQWLQYTPPTLTTALPVAEARRFQGSYLISCILGNTGFVGLGVAIPLLAAADLRWATFYAITQNAIGTYGLGSFLGQYYGKTHSQSWWQALAVLPTVPTLWAAMAGFATHGMLFPPGVEFILQLDIRGVIPLAFVLTGIRLSRLPGWHSFAMAIIPALVKTLILPLPMLAIVYGLGLRGDPLLAIAIMTSTPTAFAALILAEEYELNAELPPAAIALSTLSFIAVLPLWIFLCRHLLVFG